jgi:hypothetical protein
VFPNNNGWTLGKPDLVVQIPEPFFVPDDAEDLNVTFHTRVTEEMLARDVMVRAWEFRSGTYVAGKDTVHHMGGGILPPGFDPEADGANSSSLGFTAGGTEPNVLPEGYGVILVKGSTISFSMHYNKESGPGTGFWNRAEIGFYFAKGPIKHIVRSRTIGNSDFEIPANTARYRIGAAWTTKHDTLLMALWPHAHLRGAAFRYMATYPDGRQELLLEIPNYDQKWQISYRYREPKLVPKGTRIDVTTWYDNTAARAAKQKFNPNIPVRNGPRTQDEMLSGLLSYVELEAGQTVTMQQR